MPCFYVGKGKRRTYSRAAGAGLSSPFGWSLYRVQGKRAENQSGLSPTYGACLSPQLPAAISEAVKAVDARGCSLDLAATCRRTRGPLLEGQRGHLSVGEVGVQAGAWLVKWFGGGFGRPIAGPHGFGG